MQSKGAADMRGPAGTGEAHTQLYRGAAQGLDIYEHLRVADGLLLFFCFSWFKVFNIICYPQMHLNIKYMQKPARGSGLLVFIHHK